MNKKLSPPISLIAGMLVFAMLLASFQAAQATHLAIPILAMPSVSAGETISLARVYEESDDFSRLLEVLPPGKQVEILGLSENGAWIAVAKEDQPALGGWISIAEVKHDLEIGSTRSLVKAYQQPSSSGEIASVLPPGAKVQVLGYSPDNGFYAIAGSGASRSSVRWVAAGDLKLPDVIAETRSLTRLYRLPEASGSEITSVLPPAAKVILFGRNSAGTWFAAADIVSRQFIGWAQSGDLMNGKNGAALPVLPLR